jgi:hypothetical protein
METITKKTDKYAYSAEICFCSHNCIAYHASWNTSSGAPNAHKTYFKALLEEDVPMLPGIYLRTSIPAIQGTGRQHDMCRILSRIAGEIRSVIPGICVRRNIPAINGKEWNPGRPRNMRKNTSIHWLINTYKVPGIYLRKSVPTIREEEREIRMSARPSRIWVSGTSGTEGFPDVVIFRMLESYT